MGSSQEKPAADITQTKIIEQESASVSLIGDDMGWLRLVMDAMQEGFGLLAPDFTILELNEEAVRIDGRPRAELIGQSHWTVYPGTEHDEIGRTYRRVMTQRVPDTLKHCYNWPDGRTSWFETRAFPVENGCLAVFYRDISQKERADEKLRLSERRFKAAVGAMDGTLWTNDAKGKMIGEQPGWGALTGQSKVEYQDDGWVNAIHPDDIKATIDRWEASVAQQRPFEFEHRILRHDGIWRLYAARAIPVQNPNGDIIEWVGVHRDVTDSRADALRLWQLGDTLDAVFYVHDIDDGCISYVSAAYERIWARQRTDLYDSVQSFIEVIHPDDLARVMAAQDEQRSGTSTGIEYRLLRDDGSIRHILDRPVDAVDPVSGKRRILGMASDITDFRELQAKLTQALADKDLLAREIDHRVKNNLTVVSSLLSMQRKTATSDETRAALDEAAARVIATARVHEQLHKSNNLGVIAFGKYLEGLCDEVSKSMQRPEVSLSCKCDAIDVPANQALSLGLIANELITNAFKHGCAAGATLILVKLVKKEAEFVLSVSDDGTGADFNSSEKSDSMGHRMIQALSRQLNAELQFPSLSMASSYAIVVPIGRSKGESDLQ